MGSGVGAATGQGGRLVKATAPSDGNCDVSHRVVSLPSVALVRWKGPSVSDHAKCLLIIASVACLASIAAIAEELTVASESFAYRGTLPLRLEHLGVAADYDQRCRDVPAIEWVSEDAEFRLSTRRLIARAHGVSGAIGRSLRTVGCHCRLALFSRLASHIARACLRGLQCCGCLGRGCLGAACRLTPPSSRRSRWSTSRRFGGPSPSAGLLPGGGTRRHVAQCDWKGTRARHRAAVAGLHNERSILHVASRRDGRECGDATTACQ